MRPGSSCARLQAIRLGQGLAHAALGLSPPSGQAGQGPWPRAASGLCSRLPPATLGSHATPPSGGRSACNTVIWWPLCVQHCHLVATLHLPPVHSAGVKTISGDQTPLKVFFLSHGVKSRGYADVTSQALQFLNAVPQAAGPCLHSHQDCALEVWGTPTPVRGPVPIRGL